MARDEKLIRRMKQSPKSFRFEEIDGFLRRQGFEADQPQGGSSHYTYRRADGTKITVVRPHGGGEKHVHPQAIKTIVRTLDL